VRARELVEEASRAEQEHAGVPEVVAAGDEFLRAFEGRLLDELLDRENRMAWRARAFHAADVSVARLGRARDDAEGDELAGRRGRDRELDGGLERDEVLQHVVRRQDQHERVFAAAREHRVRGDGDGRRRVATHGLQQDRLGRQVHLAQLLGNQEAMRLVAHHHRPGGVGESGEPRRRSPGSSCVRQ
jgi:hypothetical protein